MAQTYRFDVLSRRIDHEPMALDLQELDILNIKINGIKSSKFYKLQGPELCLDNKKILAQEIFCDEILEQYFFEKKSLKTSFENLPHWVIEIEYLPGVTDNTGRSATEAVEMVLGVKGIKCYSGKIFYIWGDLANTELKSFSTKYLANPLIEKISISKFSDYENNDQFSNIQIPHVQLKNFSAFYEIDLEQSTQALNQLSKEKIWALSEEEMLCLKDYYQNKVDKDLRIKNGLPTLATNVEMEILAQTWSEHCKHKIFAANIEYVEDFKDSKILKLQNKNYESLYKTLIKGATEKIKNDRKLDWLVSVFSDNAGIVRFSDKVDLSIKVETHNSPSALDPYGGALTGIVGVNRDILGVGLGSRPIANTNVLFFAPPHWPSKETKNELPLGLHHPKRIFKGVHKGIEDGGNKSGIPTINGAIYFDYNYAGKPLVYCGTIGVMPQTSATGRKTSGKYHQPGDRVIMVGGKIGVDGIHGATFSSMELDESAPATAVQIGDPLTQRRLTDFMMKAQELELYTSVTDNGAGGLSSSVGEMAEKTNGARIDVALAPTKYPGVAPYELIISESQERMTFAVAKEDLENFLDLAKQSDVDATDLGEFNNSGYFEILYKEKTIALLEMDFLHDGLPPMQLKAKFQGEQFKSFKEENKLELRDSSDCIRKVILKLLGSDNIRSKEQWVRCYDQEVQAATLVKPFVGKKQLGPGNSGITWLYPHGGNENEAVAVGCGLNPRLSYYDTYLMTQYAIDEAVRNIICQGANPEKIALVDNFCWPDPISKNSNPDGEHKLGQLVRSCQALFDLATDYGMPFVSGKDSMKNDFIGKMADDSPVKISVPPTLLITAIGHIPEIDKVITSDFKKSGDLIFLLGDAFGEMKYSEFDRYFTSDALGPEYIDGKKVFSFYKKLHESINQRLLNSCHDISDGGALVAIIESMIGGDLGADIRCDKLTQNNTNKLIKLLFNERASRFIVSVNERSLQTFKNHFEDKVHYLGRVTDGKSLVLSGGSQVRLQIPLKELQETWRRPW